jgi:UDP-glucose 4-epimerase
MIACFAEKYKLVYKILRIGHVFGPGEEKYQKIIPLTILKLLNNEDIEIFGDGEAIRTFIYIDDVVNAILNAVELSDSENIINVVGEYQITITKLIYELINIHGRKNIKVKYLPSSDRNRNLIFDNSKLKKTLLNKYTPFLEGLRKEYLNMEKKRRI